MNRLKLILPLLRIALPLFTFFSVLAFSAGPVSAQSASIDVIDGVNMRFGDRVFKDKNPYDGTHEWLHGPASCRNELEIHDFDGDPRAEIILREVNALGECKESQESIGSKLNDVPLNSAARRFITAYRLDANNIFFPVGFRDPGCTLDEQKAGVDDKANVLRRAPEGDSAFEPNVYYQVNDGSLEKAVKLTTSSSSEGEVVAGAGSSGGCGSNSAEYDITYAALNDAARSLYDINGSTPPGGIGTDEEASAEAKPSCEEGGGELSWIICPLLRMADSFVSYLDNQINSLLTVPNGFFEGANGDNLRKTWGRIRALAYIVLIPIMLIMVIGTALGFEFISAYTVKRALPRMVAAVIFIALSFDLTKFLVILTNDVGSGLLGLMTSSFGGGDITLASLFDAGGANDAIFTAAAIGAAGTAIALGSIGILFSYALVVGLSLLVAFLILAFRQMFIIALMLLAPLAILAWIFPGNDKLWKLWWGTFSKLLLLFPLIIVLIASGRIFAQLVNDPEGSGLLETILKLTAYVAPYFLIPATFKFAGGVFATVSGMANDRSRGLFDRQRKYRAKAAGENWHDTRSGQRFSGTNALSQAANRRLQRISHANKMGLRGLVDRNARRSRIDTAASGASLAAMQEGIEKDAAFGQIKNDDDLLSAGIRGGSERDVREFLAARGRQTGRVFDEQDIAAVMSARRSMGNNFAAAAVIAKSGTGTGYAGRNGAAELTQDIITASRGDRNMENSIFAAAKSSAANGRRYDLQAGFGAFLEQKENLRNGANATDVADALTDSALDSQGAGAVLAGRGQSAENFGHALQRRLQTSTNTLQAAYASGDAQQIDEAQRRITQDLASTEALIDVAGQSSPENARILADAVHSAEIPLAGRPDEMRDWLATRADGTRLTATNITVRDMMDHMGARGGAYDEMRRNYSSSYQQQAAQRQAGAGGPGTLPPTTTTTGINIP